MNVVVLGGGVRLVVVPAPPFLELPLPNRFRLPPPLALPPDLAVPVLVASVMALTVDAAVVLTDALMVWSDPRTAYQRSVYARGCWALATS